MTDFRFPKSSRLRKQPEFTRVYTKKVFAADDTLVLQAATNDLDHSRLGLSVSRKVGNAVVRNRWKRLIREAFRLSQHELPKGIDFIVRPRKDSVANARQIKASLVDLAVRIERKLRRQKRGDG